MKKSQNDMKIKINATTFFHILVICCIYNSVHFYVSLSFYLKILNRVQMLAIKVDKLEGTQM